MASKADPKLPRARTPVLLVIGLLIVGGAAFWHLERRGPLMTEIPVLTPDAKAYTRHLQLSEVEMSAAESYFKQSLVEITGKITNAGDRPLELVELNCIFYDAYGQLVLRERVPIVRSKEGILAPGGTREFRLPFDNIPESWNRAMPQLVIAHISFG